jgi:RNA polymerase sigma-70 factor (ECF subfamily)
MPMLSRDKEARPTVKGANVNPEGAGDATSVTLLERVRARDQAAWERFVHLYTPLVYRWCRQAGLQEADAADVGQEVFRAVAGAIAQFRRDRPGDTLRGWLYVITRRKLHDFARREGGACHGAGGSDAQRRLQQLAEAESDPASADTEHEDQRLVCRRAMEILLADCEERTRQAFWRVVVEGQPAAGVAQDLGLTVNAVYVLKSRLLRRLREEFAGCLEL